MMPIIFLPWSRLITWIYLSRSYDVISGEMEENTANYKPGINVIVIFSILLQHTLEKKKKKTIQQEEPYQEPELQSWMVIN